MIDIFDVRANNWIAIDGQPVLVREMNYSPYIADNCRINGVPVSKIEGLAITFEILEKSGFVKADKTDPFGGFIIQLWEGYSLRLRVNENRWTYNYYGYEIEIKSLHRVQNIFLDLTGRELTVNL